MTIDIPYFLSNPLWYTIGDEGYELTPEAPQEAIESYKTFYNEIKEQNILVENE
jgi:hypothetical protein